MQLLRVILTVIWTLRIALPKVAVGWMFALLTIDFTRVAIFELGIAAILVTSLLSIHYLMSPFQVIIGRVADCRPLFGLRRTPYLLLGSLVASLLFLALPRITIAIGDGSMLAMLSAIMLFTLFGLATAAIADTYHSLLAEVTTKETRGAVVGTVWILMIISTIVAAQVMNMMRPEFTPEAMQSLYNLTPFVVMGCAIIGTLGIEKRQSPEQLEKARQHALSLAPRGNPLTSAVRLLKANPAPRAFFAFIFLAIFAIFLQENLIEVFGAEVFGMSITETTTFQQIWGGGLLAGMLLTIVTTLLVKPSRKLLVLIGCSGSALCFATLGLISLLEVAALVRITLFAMGLMIGIFNVGALSLMMEMTVEGATGMYMGLWGTAQALGMGASSLAGGALHTGLIGSGLLDAKVAYLGIFLVEGAALLVAGVILYHINVSAFARTASQPVNTERGRAGLMPVAEPVNA